MERVPVALVVAGHEVHYEDVLRVWFQTEEADLGEMDNNFFFAD